MTNSGELGGALTKGVIEAVRIASWLQIVQTEKDALVVDFALSTSERYQK